MSKKTYRSVDELTRDELDELKSNMFQTMLDEGLADYGYDYATDIPDEVVKKHYAGTMFVKEDFFCNLY